MKKGRPLQAWPGKKVGGAAALWLALVLAVPALLGLACGGPGATLPTAAPIPVAVPTPVPSPKVVILSVDGLRADVFQQADIPNVRGLARRGAYTAREQSVIPPVTLPSHASMLSGVDPSVHKLLWDDYRPEKGYLTVPTIFTVAKASGLRTVMVVGKEKFKHLSAPGTVDTFILAAGGDDDVANEAIVQVQAGFDLMFVHFPDVDLAGHAQGWLSPAYMAKVGVADQAIGRLLAVLPPETTVIFTSDHGGRGNTHGYDIPEDMTVPWVIAGPRVRPGCELTSRVKQTDTAATALYVLGLSLPGIATGEVVKESFAPQ
jgi:arylsulfatase A-like enzyme